MVDEELHPVVQLMLARMESNPEEFTVDNEFSVGPMLNNRIHGRWHDILHAIKLYAPPEQAEMVSRVHSGIMLGAAHKRAMQELLKGDEPDMSAYLVNPAIPYPSAGISQTILSASKLVFGGK